jgi:hypothetical protein
MTKRIVFYTLFALACLLWYLWINIPGETQEQVEAPTRSSKPDALKEAKTALEDKAWALFKAGKHDECIAFVDAEFAKIEALAREEKKDLRHFPAMQKGYHWHNLDAAGNLLRVKAESLAAQTKYEDALRVRELLVNEFPYAQSWREHPKFYRPVFEARGLWQAHFLNKAIRTDKDLSHYDYVHDSLFDDGARKWCVSAVVNDLFLKEDFASLDYACDFFAKDPKWQTMPRCWMLSAFVTSGGLTSKIEDEKRWLARKALIEKWIAANPKSQAAPLMLVNFWIEYGWKARGSDWADTVTPEGWQKLAERIHEAHVLLDKTPRDHPQWYVSRITVAMAEGEDRDATYEICQEGVQKFPWYLPIQTTFQQYLLPRWHGQPGDWQEFALKMGKEVSPMAYFHLIHTGATWEHFEQEIRSKGTDWEMLKKGGEDWAALDPRDPWPLQELAGYAWQRKDKATAQRLFNSFGNMPHPNVWSTTAGFDDVRKWALK